MDEVNKEALKQLKEYREQGAHMLIPCMQTITDVMQNFRLIVTPTTIPSHPREGYVYPHDSKQWDEEKKEWKAPVTGKEEVRFHATAFQKFAQDANIMWSRPIVTTDRDDKGRKYCEITGEIILPDGFSKYRLPDGAGMDIGIEEEALIAKYSYNGKFDDKKRWIVDRDLIRLKKYQEKLILTNAKNRVTERILGLKKTYTLDELKKPFISVRVVFWPDMNDRFTRELFIKGQVAQRFITDIYGGQGAPPMEQPAISYTGDIPPEKCQAGTDPTIVDAEVGEPTNRYPLDKSQTMTAPDEDVPFSLANQSGALLTPESLRLDFENSAPDAQVKTLHAMIAAKKQEDFVASWLKQFKQQPATPETISPKNRLKLYDYLVGMPDAGGAK